MFNSITEPSWSRTSASATMTSTMTIPVTARFWTWREAVEQASRVTGAVGRVTVRHHDGQWVVSYRARLQAINAA